MRHHNLPSSVVKNESDEPVETLLNVSSNQDQDFVSDSFGHNYRVALAHQEKAKAHKPKHDPTLEKAIAGYTKDTLKIDIFSAQDKLYSQQVNFGLSHHMPASSLKAGKPEQAAEAQPKVDELLNVSLPEDQDFVSRSFGAKSRQHH